MSADTLVITGLSPDAPMAALVRQSDGSWLDTDPANIEGAVIVLLDARDQLTCTASIPAKNERQAQAAAPFMVEDNLASTIADTHVALGPKPASEDAMRQIACVDKARFAALMARLTEAGLRPLAAMSEAAILPYSNTILPLENRLLIRAANGIPFGLDLHHASLAPMLVQHGADAQSGEAPHLMEPSTIAEMLDGINSETLLDNGVDLMQGLFAPKRDMTAFWLVWRLPMRLLAFTAVLFALSYVVGIISTDRSARALDEDATALMQRAFPGVRNEAHMRQKLRATRADGGDPFISLTAILLLAVEEIEDIQVGNMRFNTENGTLDVLVDAGEYEDIAALKRFVESRGASLQEGSSRDIDGRLEANIKITGGG